MLALITGANRGIGAALRDILSKDYEVIGTARTAPKQPGWQDLDQSDPASIADLAARIDRPLDLLVCNAGIYPDKGQNLATGYPPAMWAEGFATNVTGPFLLVQALLPRLREARGKIALISSQMASHERAPGGSYIYRASKAALLNLGRNLATDLKPDSIAVGIYHPGWVRTDMGGDHAAISPEESARGLARGFAALSPDTTGVFETWDGHPHPY
ncbi:SDR family NAD(P)-dependent oxidoreductase [Aestuariibius sp. 2305UL40-4]|uniref:SDR family NAD(P)-dependent oxidoreductase n=1 Tax=Aestuariibius violaceus TaxID=3234132 RepID=UPI00345E4F6B